LHIKKGKQVSADGFITPPSGTWKLKESPVPFLRALLLRIRNEGEGLEKTHLGKILSCMSLEASDFTQDTEMAGAQVYHGSIGHTVAQQQVDME
jgi:hypothetical protein